ncbi:MAG: HIT family protein [Methanobrevibacter arboriphilus]|uniref:HIT family protein n=1 Tax=Methanobrevibacter arboriphilus TaxID=39441 RepID=A0A843AI50_METAZ|nr:HIT family protein [Methanobrevibacter arboriphilus]MBF4469563.1 HIT family protein [Methanobrevibacter arboriphilus]
MKDSRVIKNIKNNSNKHNNLNKHNLNKHNSIKINSSKNNSSKNILAKNNSYTNNFAENASIKNKLTKNNLKDVIPSEDYLDNDLCEDKICEFSIDSSYGNLIAETDYWEIFLAPSQRYLGTCVISLKRRCEDLKDLYLEEWADFGKLVESMELANKKTFNADLFNWSCLKNSVFRNNNPKPHIHWHFIPRYKKPVVFEGLEFNDPDFGFFARAITKKIPSKMRTDLIALIKENLDI